MTADLIPPERIQQSIYLIRDQKVMIDRDLASLYGIPTKALKQAVRRNRERFPDDFMFVLDAKEFQIWRSQFVTSTADRKGLRYAPMAFTEHGVAMLSSVLNSTRAIQVNIAIIRAFIRLRRLLGKIDDIDFPSFSAEDRAMLIETMTAMKDILEAAITRAVKNKKKPT